MRNSAKGVLAAGAAVALLVGGGGTLAFWQDQATIPGDSVSSGELKLGAPACSNWVLDDGELYTTQLLVPGDSLTQTCTMALTATGDHLGANLTFDAPAWDAADDLNAELAITPTFTVGGAERSTVTDADNGASIVAVVRVDFDYAAATNLSQGVLNSLLTDGTFTLTQTHVTP